MSGRFCGLTPVAVIVALSPGFTVDGLAVQLTVGGSKALTVNCAVQSADWPGFAPSVTCPVTVKEPGARLPVSTVPVELVPATVTPVPLQLYVAVFLGFRLEAVPVMVIGSPGNTDAGLAEQAY